MHQSIESPNKAKRRVSYSAKDAESAVVYVHKIVLDLMEADYRASELTEENEVIEELGRLDRCKAELAKMGVVVEDSARGVVLFPTRHKGTKAWIVWCALTADVLHWKHGGENEKLHPIESLRETKDDDD